MLLVFIALLYAFHFIYFIPWHVVNKNYLFFYLVSYLLILQCVCKPYYVELWQREIPINNVVKTQLPRQSAATVYRP